MNLITLNRAASFFRDLVLPPTCIHCRVPIHETGFLCGGCWSEVTQVEHPFCPVMGDPLRHDGVLETKTRLNDIAFNSVRTVVLYDRIIGRIIRGLKFSDRTDLGPWLGRWMMNWASRVEPALLDSDLVVIPVPLNRGRLIRRRYNQAAELARAYCSLTSQSYRPDLLFRSRRTSPQTRLKMVERKRNVRGAFVVSASRRGDLKGARVLLIDDVFTTGATLDACARTLRRAGATEVMCFTFTRVADRDL